MLSNNKMPDDWTHVSLKETASYFIDGDWIEAEFITKEGVRIIQTGNIGIGEYLDNPDRKKFISANFFKKLNCKKVFTGDLLICRLADPIGRACFAPQFDDDFFVTVVDVVIFRPKDGYDKTFLLYKLNNRNHLKLVEDFTSGSTRQRISRTNLERIKLELPKYYKEQSKIAEILSTIDEAINNSDKLIKKYMRINQGLMQDLFRYGIDESGYPRSEKTHTFKDSTLGRIPEEWHIGPITDYLDIMTDYVANGSFASLRENVHVYDSENYAYYVRLYDLRLGLGHKNQTYTDKKSYGFLKKSFINEDDTLVANIGAYAGEVWRMPSTNRPSTIGPNMLILKSNLQCEKKYLFYYLKSEKGDKEIKNVIAGSGQPKISKTELKTIKVLKMDKSEQCRIVDILSNANEVLEKEAIYKQKLLSIKQGLMDDLFSGKVRVTELMKN